MIEMPLVERPRDPIRGSADHEIKFAVPASAAGSLRTWIGAVCRPDAVHPPARVTTVYFDTPWLALLSEKIDSDYLKTKVRVRWYGAGDSLASTAFAEVKCRVGAHRDKVRVVIDVPPSDLSRWPLHDARWPAVLGGLRAAAPTLPARLAPVLCLTYTRHRFDDPASGARVTIDSDIRAAGSEHRDGAGPRACRARQRGFRVQGRGVRSAGAPGPRRPVRRAAPGVFEIPGLLPGRHAVDPLNLCPHN